MKYIYDPPEGYFKPGFVVGEPYDGDYKDDPCFKPVKKSSKKDPEKEVNNDG